MTGTAALGGLKEISLENRWLIFLVLDACRLLIVVSRRRTKRGQCGEAWRASKRAKRSEMHSGSGKSERTGDFCGNSVNLAGNHGRVNRIAAPFSLLLCRGERERERKAVLFSLVQRLARNDSP